MGEGKKFNSHDFSARKATTVYLSAEQDEQLNALARQRRVSRSRLVGELIDAATREQESETTGDDYQPKCTRFARATYSPPGERRIKIGVWVSKRELERLDKLRKDYGTSRSRYLTLCALRPARLDEYDRIPEETITLLRHTRRNLDGVATNLNQAAKWANTERALPEDWQETLDTTRKLIRYLNEILIATRRGGRS